LKFPGIRGEALRPDDVVVDVGGNVGTVTLVLKKAFPQLRYVVQDLEKLMPAGEQVCALSTTISPLVNIFTVLEQK
jgi:hypothetical protein